MAVYLNQLTIGIPNTASRGRLDQCVCVYLGESLMQSFCARALQSDVFPVPGGPEKSESCYFEMDTQVIQRFPQAQPSHVNKLMNIIYKTLANPPCMMITLLHDTTLPSTPLQQQRGHVS